ncbi:MAG: FAD-binding oxidoreductase [Ilumatobacteraceae bacterium]
MFEGRYMERGSAEYETVRTEALFNARHPPRFPAAVLEAVCDADVVAGVRLAREQGWKVAVRSGGHAWAGWSVRDDSLLIDLAGLRDMTVDVNSMTATTRPAIRGGQEFGPFLRRYGLVFPGGHCSTVGLGGYLLQGGQGWNSRQWGWGCENVVGVDVVTADGELVHADERHHADLLWAARGAGPGFFGVVTRFYLRVHRMPEAFTHTTYAFPIECFDELIAWAHDLLPTLDVRVEAVIVGTRIPPPEIDVGGEPLLVMHVTGMFDTEEEARTLMAPLETCPVLDRALSRIFAEPTAFEDENTIMTPRTRRACATRRTARGPMHRPPSSSRSSARSIDRYPPANRSSSGTAGRRLDHSPTWRSRWRATSTSPPTRSGSTSTTTRRCRIG